MVMPIAEAVLQQLICTGLADSHNDSETADVTEDESGTLASREVVRGLEGGATCFSHCSPFVTSVVPRSRFRQGGEPGEETAGASLPQREVCACSSGAESPPPLRPYQLQTVQLANARLAHLVSMSAHFSAWLTCALALRDIKLAAAEDSPLI